MLLWDWVKSVMIQYPHNWFHSIWRRNNWNNVWKSTCYTSLTGVPHYSNSLIYIRDRWSEDLKKFKIRHQPTVAWILLRFFKSMWTFLKVYSKWNSLSLSAVISIHLFCRHKERTDCKYQNILQVHREIPREQSTYVAKKHDLIVSTHNTLAFEHTVFPSADVPWMFKIWLHREKRWNLETL